MRIDEIARFLGGRLEGEASREIRGAAALENAGSHDLTFAEGPRAAEKAAGSQAGCILVEPGVSVPGKTSIAVARPKLAFARAAAAVLPAKTPPPGVHPTAVIAPDARLGKDVSVGPYVVVEHRAVVGARTHLAAGVFVGEGAEVGEDCVFYPRVTVYAGAKIGHRVILHAGVVIGSDGFGYVFAEGRHWKFPQIGQAILEDDVEIGSNSTVDRGSLGTTVIGQGTKVDNLVQVAHNVRIGRHCVIAAQTGISGSCTVGDYVVMGGQVGMGDHAHVEDQAILGGGAGVLPGKVVRRGETIWGRPGRPLAEFKRLYAHYAQLPRLAEKIKELSRRLDKLSV